MKKLIFINKTKLFKFILVIFLFGLVIELNQVFAETCQEKGGRCVYDPNFACPRDLGYYVDSSLEGCEQDQVCCFPPSGSSQESGTGLPEEVESPTSVIPYEFETGIPGIVGPGESLQKMTLAEFIQLLIKYVFRISGILAFVMIIWGGILYLVSGGDAKKQKSAQEKITAAVIGLILLFAFWLILNTINPDILKIPKSTLEIKEETGEEEKTIEEGKKDYTASELATKILNNPNIHLYTPYGCKTYTSGTYNDLKDVASGQNINAVDNSCLDVKANCISDIQKYAAKTINPNLLKVVDNITSRKVWGDYCSSTYEIGPFISDHWYCYEGGQNSSHTKGKAFDLALQGKTKSLKECSAALILDLCKDKLSPSISIEKIIKSKSEGGYCDAHSFICTTKVGGISIGVVDELCDANEPHIHIQLY